ncbi:flagellar basal-body rod protein FlgG [Halalkalibacter wakoensis JCM 9140]|uniref:Flagellar basal-body rod protein FlgG n=1 Tax=Halalkalibacter wakoensis JCM 9140 TaxID=1236970 RepID=W4QAV4_9BACI|nr:flagellar hook-basal body protein [Halalkalibacter wakoensis]GAE28499.1 flagellar basal-body rod protein FlgG [Halalkalibacter wakoensis JCM 9140]
MNQSMITASVTMGQLQRKLDTISHNIANTNTTGFKSREATFSDLLFQQVNNQSREEYEVGRLTPNGIRVGTGAKIAQTAVRQDVGALMQTERQLDFALTEKNHFFRIETVENGAPVERITRDGAFYLTENPNNAQQLSLVTANGDFVLNGEGNRIAIPANFQSISFSQDGELEVTLRDGTMQNVGQLGLTNVLKPQLLDSVGNNLYRFPDLQALGFAVADVRADFAGNGQQVNQGFLEGSNVDLSREMNALIEAQRHYQFNSRSISMADEMSGLVNGLRR